MRSTEILREEHDAVLVVLDQLDQAVAAAELGVPVPIEIFSDIEEFFTIFVGQCHHGKEEEAVFQQFDTGGDSQLVARSLTEEHDAGRALSASYAQAVAAYVPGDIVTAQRLANAARAYDTMLRDHIEEENNDLFPLMERSLNGIDAEITAEFDRIRWKRSAKARTSGFIT